MRDFTHFAADASHMWSSNTGERGVETEMRSRHRNEVRQTNTMAHRIWKQLEEERHDGKRN